METEREQSQGRARSIAVLKQVAGVLLVLLVLSGAWFLFREYYPSDELTIEATGTIEATTVELNAKLPGAISKVTVEAGDSVTKEQVVAELSRTDLVAQRERDALGVLKAEAQLADLTSGARSQEISEALANVDIAKANLEKSTADFARSEILFNQGAIAKDQFEKAQVALQLHESQLKAAEARLSLLQEGTRPQVISAARAEVERGKAVLKATEAMLADTKIASPLQGTVINKHYEAGEYIPAGASVATVADLDDMWIRVFIPTDDLPYIKLGQEVSFTVSGYDQAFKGRVVEIASQGEFTPKTIQTKKERTNVVFGVKIKVDNQDGVLKPGMPADVVMGRREGQ